MKSRILFFSVLLTVPAFATGWPVMPRDSVHPLGNNWGEYQDYGGQSYCHPGIDVFPQHQGDPVYAVAHGWVKAWGTTQSDYHWRLAISDSAPAVRTRSPGWLYAHVDPTRTHKNVGDEVNEGDQIGYIVPWPVTGFDHTHFARISDTGTTWSRFPEPTWWFIENPLTVIRPNTDNVAPVFQNAVTNQRFGICRNNTNNYLNITNLTGDVDIVARCYDQTGFPTSSPTWDRLSPIRLVWSARGSVAEQAPTLGPDFTHGCPPTSGATLTNVIFKETSPCRSLGDYDYRDYYFVATNNDGDSTIEITDTSGCWHTGTFPDDDYWVKVTAYDVAGNTTAESMLVHTANGMGISSGGNADWHNLDVSTLTRAGSEQTVSFSLTRHESVRLELFDAAGRLEYSSGSQSFEPGSHRLSFTPRTNGVHLVVLSTDADRIVHKLTVVH